MPAISSCSAIVLAGGRATRLGGVDKALLPLAGRPLLAHVLARLQPQVDDVVINYNRDPAVLAGFGHAVVADASADYSGPLAGIAAALPRCRHELVLVVPCDAPFLPRDLQSRLAGALAPGIDLVMAHDGIRLQPLFLLLRRTLLDSLLASLAAGDRKVERWCLAQHAATVRFDDPRAFTNLNAPQDLQTAEKNAREGETPLSGTENGA
jgi:molybdopterin-guanine dinucleotide biosynthesis protein A